MGYRTVSSGLVSRMVTPVSSQTSRTAVTGSSSPFSTLPFGSVQSSYRLRWMTTTSVPRRGWARVTTAPPARMSLVDVLLNSFPEPIWSGAGSWW